MLDFEEEVIQTSYQKPVLVDFWAEWCQPCRMLTPILDQLAVEHAGSWNLVKINTEEFPALSNEYKIRSIPNVKLFVNGEVIGEFMGVLSKIQVEKWLSEHIPADHDKDVQLIMENSSITIAEKARQLETVLDVYPDKKEVKLATAFHSMFSNPSRSIELITEFKMSDPKASMVQMIKDISRFMSFESENKSPFDDTLVQAQKALRNENWEEGIQRLIDLVSIDKSYEKDLPRKTTIGVFQFLGPKHPVTMEYRKMFDMILW